MSNFYPLEVVGRGSETHRQGGKNLNCIYLKGLAQTKIIKKSVILFRVLNMTI